ncbi:MAG: sugar phosphate isomerase/epimerase family protein [Candidatus Scalinduaceae bacterium]
MLGISTVWKSGKVKDGQKLLECFSKLGFRDIELEYRISGETFREIKKFLNKGNGVRISSIHNFFPIPETFGEGGADVFLLSTEDKEERALAVKYTIGTMQIAAELGAGAVILHLGRVPMDTVKQDLFRLYDEGKIGSNEHRKMLEEFRLEREKKKGKSFDVLLQSIDEIQKAAESLGVNVGIENRYYFREYPNLDEIGIVLEKFGNGRIGYWHDVGHAKVQENLGIIRPNQLLETYGKYLLGVHLHDATGYIDHQVPGAGEVDFRLLKKYLKKDTLKILEIHPRETKRDLMDGVDFLKSIGFA